MADKDTAALPVVDQVISVLGTELESKGQACAPIRQFN